MNRIDVSSLPSSVRDEIARYLGKSIEVAERELINASEAFVISVDASQRARALMLQGELKALKGLRTIFTGIGDEHAE